MTQSFEVVRWQTSYLRRLLRAGVNLLAPLHTGLLVSYFALRALGRQDLWYVDVAGYILPWLFVPTLVLLPGVVLRRSRIMWGLTLLSALLFAVTYGHLYLPRLPVRAAGPAFTVMTYNVLYSNSHVDHYAAEIEKHAPDIVGLHELQEPMAQALVRRLGQRYPYYRLEPGRGLLSRYPILEYEAFRLGAGRAHWAQQCVLDVDGRRLTVLNVHPRSPPLRGFHPWGLSLGVPAGFSTEERDGDVGTLVSRLDRTEGSLVVIGDLNLTDQQVLYGALRRKLNDAHRESGWGMGFTFASDPRLGLALWRIDYVFHSSDLVALRTSVGDYGGSDHRPVIAELAFRR